MQAQLDLTRRGTNAGDLPEATVVYVVIGVPVAGDVEDVEKVGAKTEYMLFPDVEVFEERHVDLPVTRRTLRTISRGSELKLTWLAIGADPVSRTVSAVVGGLIGSKPMQEGAVSDDHGVIVIRAIESVNTVGIVGAVGKDCNWETG